MKSRLCSVVRIDRRIPGLQSRLLSGNSLTEEELAEAIDKSWSRETSDDPLGWSHGNPARGQCAVTALIVQDLLGGDLLCANVNLTTHYWNLLPNGSELDLTKGQLGKSLFAGCQAGLPGKTYCFFQKPGATINGYVNLSLPRFALRPAAEFREHPSIRNSSFVIRHSTVTLLARFLG